MRRLFTTTVTLSAAATALHAQPAADEARVATEIFREAAGIIAEHALKPVTVPHVAEFALRELLYKYGAEASASEGVAALDDGAALAKFGEIAARLAAANSTQAAALAEQAIGMYCRTSDSYSEYCDSATYSLYSRQSQGRTAGVGISLLSRDGEFYCYPMPGSTAVKAGIANGDQLLSVGGRDIAKSSMLAIGALVRGEPGTPVTLGIKRSFGRKEEVTVVREVQTMPVVLVEREFGQTTIRIRRITTEAVSQLRDALGETAKSGKKHATLDLRGCPGGNLDAMLALADLFLPTGAPIATLVERSGRTEYHARDAEKCDIEKITILHDNGTASAAELLICCLIENLGPQRISTHGEKTFGKAAVISRVPPLRGGGQLDITSGMLYGPSGRTWEGDGLLPSLENGGEIFAAGRQAAIPAMTFKPGAPVPVSAAPQQTQPAQTPTTTANAMSVPVPPAPIQPPPQQPSASSLDSPIEMAPVGKGSGRF